MFVCVWLRVCVCVSVCEFVSVGVHGMSSVYMFVLCLSICAANAYVSVRVCLCGYI